ncbi:MAG: aminomethyltransferase [Cryomorphaceae bacterium]|jgi:aminomethyltransferase
MTGTSPTDSAANAVANSEEKVAVQSTPLIEQHRKLNAKIVDFGGWALPVNYGSQIEEHHAVRKQCGMFDVSHMTVSDISGPDTLGYLGYLLANDINKASKQAGKAVYSCMLNERGGVIDDLIVYYLDDQRCRVVTNASTNEKDLAWMHLQSSQFDVEVKERADLALLALQGPTALAVCGQTLPPALASLIGELKRFQGGQVGAHFVGRTGYTGEDGVEFIAPAEQINTLWETFSAAGVQACGLGARDTLRLESGMSLYGNDLDEEHSPLESGLNWSVRLSHERDFIGKQALLEPSSKTMIGLILQDRGVLRGHQKVILEGTEIGEITSGTFSPSLQQSIALARIDTPLDIGTEVQIAVRNKFLKAIVARYPFVKNGLATN